MFSSSDIPKEHNTIPISNGENVTLEADRSDIALSISGCNFLYRLKMNTVRIRFKTLNKKEIRFKKEFLVTKMQFSVIHDPK